jgi:tetratricopeptide (TPR) repeat protein
MRSALARAAVRAAAIAACAAALHSAACTREPASPHGAASTAAPRPSILLVTLDTTRADAIGPEAVGIQTPAFNAVAARGRRFRQAYATVPETLPSHVSMLTGLYPAGHAIHENGRSVPPGQALLAERLHAAGYETAAFVSSFILTKRFGLARGFDVYDDQLGTGQVERHAAVTTDAAVAYLEGRTARPLFLWVHYFDPHDPYAPPEPFRAQYPGRPYLGEVAFMDQQLGRLLQAFEQRATAPIAVIVVGDHGEGLGDHGEALHGNLLYQSTMHVPLAMMGPGVTVGTADAPASTRRVFHTILDWAGLGSDHSLRTSEQEVVLGEAMKPYLNYGWQPQTMAVEGAHKSILAGRLEVYDVVNDAGETRDIADQPDRPLVPAALRDYPTPSPSAGRAPETLDPEAQKSLASLGYVSAGATPVVRKDAPRPVDMVRQFAPLERASALFVAGNYAQAIPLFERILAADPYNLDAMLRVASAHSALGHDRQAEAMFAQAARKAPQSADVKVYLALHYARTPDWQRAVPLLEQVAAENPDRMPVLEALADMRDRQNRVPEALALRQRIFTLRTPTPAELVKLGQLAMEAGSTPVALDAFERARTMQGRGFLNDFELGVLYLDARRFVEARDALDRVPASHPEYPMVLFKRAQVSVLLKEPDASARIDRARRGADASTRDLIARERLFQQ